MKQNLGHLAHTVVIQGSFVKTGELEDQHHMEASW